MAVIKTSLKQVAVRDRDLIIDACKELGVRFGCENGVCKTCEIEVLEGANNLSELNIKEKRWRKDKHNRLACQCRIKHGTVKIRYEE